MERLETFMEKKSRYSFTDSRALPSIPQIDLVTWLGTIA